MRIELGVEGNCGREKKGGGMKELGAWMVGEERGSCRWPMEGMVWNLASFFFFLKIHISQQPGIPVIRSIPN